MGEVKSSQVKFITPIKQRVATALWVGGNSKTLKIMLVAVPVLHFRGFGGFGVLFAPLLSGLGDPGCVVLRFCGFGGFGVVFAPPLSGLGDPGCLVLRFRGFLLLLLRVFRDVVVAPVLDGGGGE